MTKTRRADAESASVSRGGSDSPVSSARGSVSGLAKTETRAEASPTRTVCPPPAGDALGAAPQPRPATATAAVERDGESRPSLLVTVRGEDLELCVGVAAETNGWPCAATLVATEKKIDSKNGSDGVSRVFVSPKLALSVRVYPPTLNGALVPAPLFRGGGDARDWSRVVVALRGDFGDARVAARVADASGFAEPFRSRL